MPEAFCIDVVSEVERDEWVLIVRAGGTLGDGNLAADALLDDDLVDGEPVHERIAFDLAGLNL